MLSIFGRPLFGSDDSNALIKGYSYYHVDRPSLRGGRTVFSRDGGFGFHHNSVTVEWSFPSTSFRVGFDIDGTDRDMTMKYVVPPVAIYVKFGGLPLKMFEVLGIDWESNKNTRNGTYGCKREVCLGFYDWTCHLSLWAMRDSWSSRDPKWMSMRLNVLDLLFGRTNHDKVLVEEREISIEMPEKIYRGVAKVYDKTWSRPRWPFRFHANNPLYRRLICYEADMIEPVPFPGKGENSWDCGQDSLHGQSGPGGFDEAVAGVVRSVTESRLRHGGPNWKPEEAVVA